MEEAQTFTRYADDKRLNAAQKQTPRWDDPARTFVEDLKPVTQKHRYQPNRFNIPPGKEWDGVDRSNGFETKYFQKQAAVRDKKAMGYQYDVANY